MILVSARHMRELDRELDSLPAPLDGALCECVDCVVLRVFKATAAVNRRRRLADQLTAVLGVLAFLVVIYMAYSDCMGAS